MKKENQTLSSERLHITRTPPRNFHRRFVEDVCQGLSASPKQLPPVYFYDETGSQLFEKICELPEYYITRTERWILENYREEILSAATAEEFALVEFGSGSSYKTRLLIAAALQCCERLSYHPIDISETMLVASAETLLQDFPELEIDAFAGEYDEGIDYIGERQIHPKMILFLGSNIGNFPPQQAVGFLRRIRRVMTAEDVLLLGTDMRKPREVLERAYNDRAGVTAAFNLNLLHRINRELQADFQVEQFAHHAFFNEEASRVEMHLRSLASQTVRIGAADCSFHFAADELIHTENSYKFTPEMVNRLLADADLRLQHVWQDPRGYFRLNLVGIA